MLTAVIESLFDLIRFAVAAFVAGTMVWLSRDIADAIAFKLKLGIYADTKD